MAIHRSTGNRTSDSWSRCDPNQYSSLYDVRKRSDIKQEPSAATRPIHKDTIEISRDKLQKEALNSLRHTSKYVIAQNGFMRVGKYLFLAAALPPYFMIYGLPKWILVEGMPALFSFSLWMWKKVRDQTEKQIHSGTRKVIQMAQFVQGVMQVMLQPLVHMALQIRESFRHFRDYSLLLIKKMTAKIKHGAHFPRLNVTLSQRVNDIRYFFSKINKKWSEKKEEISLQVQQGIQWIKQSPQLILNWGQFQFQRFGQHALSLVHQWKNRFEASQQWAQKGTEWTSLQLKTCLKVFKKPFVLISHLYKRYAEPSWEKLKENYKEKWLKVDHFLKRRHRRSLVFLQAQQEKLKRLSSECFLSFIVNHPSMNQLHSALQKSLRKCLLHPITRKVCDGVLKSYSFITHILLQFAKIGLHALPLIKSIFTRCWNGIRAIIQLGSNSLNAVLAVAMRLFQQGALYALYYFLLFLTISLILLIWAFRSLGEYTGYLFSTFSFNIRKSH